MRLLKVELKRFWARRLTWVAFVGLVGLMIVSSVGTFFSLVAPSAEEKLWAEESYQESLADWQENGDEYLASCLASETEMGNPEAAKSCAEWNQKPERDMFFGFHTPFDIQAEESLEGYGALLGFAALVVGASFFAAEMATGAISNWLTFEPRRVRVYLSKISAAALGIIPIAVTALAVGIAADWLVYAARDLLGTPDADLWRVLALGSLRIALLMAAAAVIGAALGAVTRHTAAVIGLVVGWAIVDQMVFFGIFSRLQQWSGVNNMQAWIASGTTYYSEKCTLTERGRECVSVDAWLSVTHGGVYLAVATVLVVGLGLLIFRRRDVA